MRIAAAVIIIGAALVTGCEQSVIVSRAVGGGPKLVRDCGKLWAEYQATQKETWIAGDSSLPDSVVALKPQMVQALHQGGVPLIDIQISGGFSHRGLIVVVSNTTPEFVPRKSTWTVTKIGDGIFEYRE